MDWFHEVIDASHDRDVPAVTSLFEGRNLTDPIVADALEGVTFDALSNDDLNMLKAVYRIRAPPHVVDPRDAFVNSELLFRHCHFLFNKNIFRPRVFHYMMDFDENKGEGGLYSHVQEMILDEVAGIKTHSYVLIMAKLYVKWNFYISRFLVNALVFEKHVPLEALEIFLKNPKFLNNQTPTLDYLEKLILSDHVDLSPKTRKYYLEAGSLILARRPTPAPYPLFNPWTPEHEQALQGLPLDPDTRNVLSQLLRPHPPPPRKCSKCQKQAPSLLSYLFPRRTPAQPRPSDQS